MRADWPHFRHGIGLGLLTLAGCAAIPPPPAIGDPPEQFRNLPGTADDAQPLPDPRRWWESFGDVTLNRLEESALATNPGIREASYRIEAARLLEGPAKARFRPNVSFHTFSQPNIESTASYFQSGFDAQWELGLFGRSRSERQLAAVTTDDALIDQQAAQVSVAAEVAREYLALRHAQLQGQLLSELVAIQQAAVTHAQARVRLGLASSADVERAQVAALEAAVRAGQPSARIERSLTRLAALCDTFAPDSSLGAGALPPPLKQSAFATLPVDLLRTRPEIRHAEAAVRKAAAELHVAKADRWPQVTLVGDLTYASKIDGDELLSPRRLSSLGPVISMPLFDWGTRQARAESRGHLLSAATLAYRAAIVDAVAETESALAQLAQLDDHCNRQLEVVDRLRGLEQSTENRLRLGLADRSERTVDRARTLEAQIALSEAQQARADAFIALYKCIGGAALPPASVSPP